MKGEGFAPRWYAIGVACVALAALVLWPGLRGDFVWDDDLLLLDHPNYRRPELILQSLRSLFIISPNYLRPVGYLSFFLDYSLFGPRPLPYHVENLVFHGLSTFLVVRLMALLGASRPAMAASGVLFALHPSRVEGVVFISSRFDLLAGFLFLCSLLLHRRASLRGSSLARWGAAGVFALALLAKEMAITLPFVAWYGDRFLWGAHDRGGGRRWERVGRYAPYGAVVAGYLGVRRLVLGTLRVQTDLAVPLRSSLEHALLVGKTAWGYVRFVLFPYAPSPVHYLSRVSLADASGWAGLLLMVAILWALLTGRLRGPMRDGVVLFFALLAPVMNLVPIRLAGPGFMAERFLYLPLLGVALGLRGLPWDRRGTRGLAVIVALSWAVVGRHTAGRWASDRTLFEWVARRTPQSALGFTNLALEETRDGGSLVHAIVLGESAIVRDRFNPDAWDNLGVAYYKLGMLSHAESCFVQALRLAPGHPLFSSNLAGTWRSMGRCPEALELLSRVLARDSTAASASLNVGLCYLQMGWPDSAVEPLRRAAILMDVDGEAWMTLAHALLRSGREEEAWWAIGRAVPRVIDSSEASRSLATWGREALQERRVHDAVRLLGAAGRLWPRDAAVANDLGVALRAGGALAAAESSFARAVALAPGLAISWANRGETLWLSGRTAEAESVLSSCIQRWPDLADAYRHLARLRLAEGRTDEACSLGHAYLARAPSGPFAEEVRSLLARQAPSSPTRSPRGPS